MMIRVHDLLHHKNVKLKERQLIYLKKQRDSLSLPSALTLLLKLAVAISIRLNDSRIVGARSSSIWKLEITRNVELGRYWFAHVADPRISPTKFDGAVRSSRFPCAREPRIHEACSFSPQNLLLFHVTLSRRRRSHYHEISWYCHRGSRTHLMPPTRERGSARLCDRTIPRICIFSPFTRPPASWENERFEELHT